MKQLGPSVSVHLQTTVQTQTNISTWSHMEQSFNWPVQPSDCRVCCLFSGITLPPPEILMPQGRPLTWLQRLACWEWHWATADTVYCVIPAGCFGSSSQDKHTSRGKRPEGILIRSSQKVTTWEVNTLYACKVRRSLRIEPGRIYYGQVCLC